MQFVPLNTISKIEKKKNNFSGKSVSSVRTEYQNIPKRHICDHSITIPYLGNFSICPFQLEKIKNIINAIFAIIIIYYLRKIYKK